MWRGRTVRSLSSVVAGISLVTHAFGHGDLHEQIDAVTKRIAQEPNNAELHFKRAELRRLHQEWRAAAADYDQAERLNPALPVVHLGRGKLCAATGRFADAKGALQTFLSSQPAHPDGLVTLAQVEVRTGEFLAAAEHFRLAIEHSPAPEPDIYLERAKALTGAGTEHVGEALRTLDEGLAKLGRIAALGLFAVELELSLGQFDAALARLDWLSTAAPRKERWFERRGDVLSRAGRTDAAAAEYEAASAAISKLPPHLSAAQSTLELQQRLQRKLAALKTPVVGE